MAIAVCLNYYLHYNSVFHGICAASFNRIEFIDDNAAAPIATPWDLKDKSKVKANLK